MKTSQSNGHAGFVCALLCGLGILVSPPAAAQKTETKTETKADTKAAATTVRFASVGGLTDAGLYLAEELGFFAQARLAVTLKRMASAPDLITALATDQLDVAGISITPGLFSAVQQGIEIRIVGDKQSVRPGFAATRLVIRTDLAQATIPDSVRGLKGRNVAVTARGSSSFYNLVTVLEASGLRLEDVKITQLAFQQMVPALASRAVDAAYILEPFLSQAIKDKLAFDAGHMGNHTGGVSWVTVPLVYSEKFTRNRTVAQAFMTAYVRGVRVYNDAFGKGLDKARVVEIMARRANVDREIVEASAPAGLDPDQTISIDSLQKTQAFFITQKMLDKPADLANLVDTSFARPLPQPRDRFFELRQPSPSHSTACGTTLPSV